MIIRDRLQLKGPVRDRMTIPVKLVRDRMIIHKKIRDRIPTKIKQ